MQGCKTCLHLDEFYNEILSINCIRNYNNFYRNHTQYLFDFLIVYKSRTLYLECIETELD